MLLLLCIVWCGYMYLFSTWKHYNIASNENKKVDINEV